MTKTASVTNDVTSYRANIYNTFSLLAYHARFSQARIVLISNREAMSSVKNLELTFRLATPGDFDEILKLSEGIYDGDDYLPFRYHKWMKMDKMDVILAHCGEKLVGLIACSIVDDGRTALRRAARTLAEFRGRGVYKQLSQAMYEFIRKQYPSVCRERFTSLDNFSSATTLMQLDLLCAFATKKSLRSHQFSTPDNSTQIKACTKEYLCDVIFSSPLAQELFPDKVIIPDYIPVEPLRSNIDYLQQEIELYFAVEKCSDGGFPRSVSVGVLVPAVKCIDWYVTVYTSDPVLYEAHLFHQFQRAWEVIDSGFTFNSFQDKHLTHHGRKVLQEGLELELDEEMSKRSMKLYENKFLQ
ncbi:histidine N-acetyltransferase-like [Oculina patagonica]